MKCGEDGIELIKHYESFQAKPYTCPAGKATIGYGSTEYPDGTPVRLSDPAITEADACQFLADTLGQYEDAVSESVKVEITQSMFDACVSLTYNIGSGAFRLSTLVKKLNAGDVEGAGFEFKKWVHGGGRVLPGLVARREAEFQLFMEGV